MYIFLILIIIFVSCQSTSFISIRDLNFRAKTMKHYRIFSNNISSIEEIRPFIEEIRPFIERVCIINFQYIFYRFLYKFNNSFIICTCSN